MGESILKYHKTLLIPARVKLFVTKGLIAYFDEVVVEEL